MLLLYLPIRKYYNFCSKHYNINNNLFMKTGSVMLRALGQLSFSPNLLTEQLSLFFSAFSTGSSKSQVYILLVMAFLQYQLALGSIILNLYKFSFLAWKFIALVHNPSCSVTFVGKFQAPLSLYQILSVNSVSYNILLLRMSSFSGKLSVNILVSGLAHGYSYPNLNDRFVENLVLNAKSFKKCICLVVPQSTLAHSKTDKLPTILFL